MKELYLNIMEQALCAYSEEDLDREVARFTRVVANNEKTEHDFHRIAVNIAILNTAGRRMDLYPRMLQMMDLCFEGRIRCPDFTVKELALAIKLLEETETVPGERIARWRQSLAAFDPFTGYAVRTWTKPPEWKCTNIPAFACVGEVLRCGCLGLDPEPFLDRQLPRILAGFDENGMFRDRTGLLAYDLVARSNLSLMLCSGYNGKYRDVIDTHLKKAGLMTLKTQSVSGEIPFGGRSQQYLHNEAWLISVLEYEAGRYARLGEWGQAGQFKAAAKKSAQYLLDCLRDNPAHHNKNCYDDLQIGCEGYAFFNKYMITLGSAIYTAYIMADDSIQPTVAPADLGGFALSTSPAFHKMFANAGGYFLQWELDARELAIYDANGLGRVHKADCPPALLLSVPFSGMSQYTQEGPNPRPMSLCSYMEEASLGTMCGADVPAQYRLVSMEQEPDRVCVTLDATQIDGMPIRETYTVSEDGIHIALGAFGEGFFLPVLDFDGKRSTRVEQTEDSICAYYKGCFCRYTFEGTVEEPYTLYYNRNGRYRVYKVRTKAVRIRMGRGEQNG